MTRLRRAAENGELRPEADLDVIAKALIGTLLLEVLTRKAADGALATRYDGLLDALLQGASGITREGVGGSPLPKA